MFIVPLLALRRICLSPHHPSTHLIHPTHSMKLLLCAQMACPHEKTTAALTNWAMVTYTPRNRRQIFVGFICYRLFGQ